MLLQAQCIISQPSVNSNWSYSPETPNLGLNRRVYVPCDLEIWQVTLKNNRVHLLCYFKLSASLHSHWPIRAGVTAQFWSNLTIFFASNEFYKWPWKNDRPPLLYPFKLYASFHSHWWIQIWVIVRKRSNWVKLNDFLPPVTLKFYGWPWKTIGHFFYTHSSLRHHIKAIGGFRFELQSGNA